MESKGDFDAGFMGLRGKGMAWAVKNAENPIISQRQLMWKIVLKIYMLWT